MTGDPVASQKPPRSRRRPVLYAALAVGVLAAALVAVLASSKPVQQTAAESPLIGKPAPPVTGPALDGSGRKSLAGLSGRWVVVNFSASWCIPCRQELPELLAFTRQHPAGDAVVFAVEFDPADRANLASLLHSENAPWPAVNDPAAEVAYGVTGIPESYVVNPAGRVAAKFVGGVTAAELDRFLASHPGA